MQSVKQSSMISPITCRNRRRLTMPCMRCMSGKNSKRVCVISTRAAPIRKRKWSSICWASVLHEGDLVAAGVGDVEHIRDYIAQDAPAYAQPFVERLLHATRHLPQFPHSGRAMPEAKNLRICVFRRSRSPVPIHGGTQSGPCRRVECDGSFFVLTS